MDGTLMFAISPERAQQEPRQTPQRTAFAPQAPPAEPRLPRTASGRLGVKRLAGPVSTPTQGAAAQAGRALRRGSWQSRPSAVRLAYLL